MMIRVRLFAAARELAGSDQLVVELPDGATVDNLQRAIIEVVPALARIVPHSLWAVGIEYVGRDTRLAPDSDVALIPPVSGG